MPPVGQAIHQPIRHRTCSQLSYRRSCHRRTNLSAIACPAGLATNELGALRAHASADHVEHTGHVRRGGRDTVPEDAESPFALGGGGQGAFCRQGQLTRFRPYIAVISQNLRAVASIAVVAAFASPSVGSWPDQAMYQDAATCL